MKPRPHWHPFPGRALRRLPLPWERVLAEEGHTALRLLARFRKLHPEHGKIPAEQLVWGYVWVEERVLLDMDMPAEERAERRHLHCTVHLSVSHDGFEEFTRYSYDYPPDPVADFIAEEEYARRAEVDWGCKG